MVKRAGYSLATMVSLVVLRLVIGWHFYSEGSSHLIDPAWSSEGFLKAAKGPFADHYQSVLPGFHGWDSLEQGASQPLAADSPEFKAYREALIKNAGLTEDQVSSKPAAAIIAWGARLEADFANYLLEFRNAFGPTPSRQPRPTRSCNAGNGRSPLGLARTSRTSKTICTNRCGSNWRGMNRLPAISPFKRSASAKNKRP